MSYACTAEGSPGHLELDAVTTGAPLPPPDRGVAALVEDLWIEVRITPGASAAVDPAASQRCLEAFSGP